MRHDMMMAIAVSGLALASLSHANAVEDVAPLPTAHAHNDYYHKRPLLDALEQGFCSVETDIFLVDGELLVGHSRFELQSERSLERLYLKPLLQRVKLNGGRVFRDGPLFSLLVDIKTDGADVYAKLEEILPRYSAMLTRVENGQLHAGAVQVIISGDRPKEAIVKSKIRYVGIDGRLSDLDSDLPAHLLPLISDRWTSHFRWRGQGTMPVAERDQLRSIVERAHRAGRRVRFWATPENEDLWKMLTDEQVDHINTDQLERLRKFLTRQPSAPSEGKKVAPSR